MIIYSFPIHPAAKKGKAQITLNISNYKTKHLRLNILVQILKSIWLFLNIFCKTSLKLTLKVTFLILSV